MAAYNQHLCMVPLNHLAEKENTPCVSLEHFVTDIDHLR